MLTRDDYLSFRRKYEPTIVKLVIVAESPPKSGLYFYNPEGRTSEPLDGWSGDIRDASAMLEKYSADEAPAVIAAALDMAKSIIMENWDLIEKLAAELIERRTLTGDQVRALLI